MSKPGDLDKERMERSEGSLEKEDSKRVEKDEEAKLKAKYPSVARPGPGLLQKLLQKGQKYFDSGDYNMAKANNSSNSNLSKRLPASTLSQPPPPPAPPTGDTIPTPDCLATRKVSIHVQSKLATGAP